MDDISLLFRNARFKFKNGETFIILLGYPLKEQWSIQSCIKASNSSISKIELNDCPLRKLLDDNNEPL